MAPGFVLFRLAIVVRLVRGDVDNLGCGKRGGIGRHIDQDRGGSRLKRRIRRRFRRGDDVDYIGAGLRGRGGMGINLRLVGVRIFQQDYMVRVEQI